MTHTPIDPQRSARFVARLPKMTPHPSRYPIPTPIVREVPVDPLTDAHGQYPMHLDNLRRNSRSLTWILAALTALHALLLL